MLNLRVSENNVAVFRQLTCELAKQTGETVATDEERMTLALRFVQTTLTVGEDRGVAGPFSHILGSHRKAPQPALQPHVALRDFVGIDTQAQLSDIRRWNSEADDAWIREMAIDAVYYVIEPTVEESDAERQIERIRRTYGYDVGDDQMMAIAIDQLHWEMSRA